MYLTLNSFDNTTFHMIKLIDKLLCIRLTWICLRTNIYITWNWKHSYKRVAVGRGSICALIQLRYLRISVNNVHNVWGWSVRMKFFSQSWTQTVSQQFCRLFLSVLQKYFYNLIEKKLPHYFYMSPCYFNHIILNFECWSIVFFFFNERLYLWNVESFLWTLSTWSEKIEKQFYNFLHFIFPKFSKEQVLNFHFWCVYCPQSTQACLVNLRPLIDS